MEKIRTDNKLLKKINNKAKLDIISKIIIASLSIFIFSFIIHLFF